MAALLPGSALLRAQTGTSIGPTPATLEIAVGEIGAVTVVLDGAQEAYGIDVRGSFDPNVIELVAAAPSSPLTAGGFIKPDFVVLNKIDNIAGTFQWAATQVNPSAPASGSGPILIAQARGKAGGRSTPIEITSVELSDRSGNTIAVTRRAGTVRVLGSAEAVTPIAPTATLPPERGVVPTSPPAATPIPPTPTVSGKVVPGGPNPTPSPPPAATSTRAATPAAALTPTAPANPTRAVVNVTAAPAAATSPAPDLPATPVPVAPRATPAPVPTGGPVATLAAPVASGAAAIATGAPTPRIGLGPGVTPTAAAEAIVAVAQSGLAPKAPGAQPPGGVAAPANVNSSAAASAPDPVTGIVLLAIGLAGVYGFGAVDRRRQGRSK